MPYTARINTPINHVQLTNVAVVRMNKGGKRFEIACYRNKVVDYRQGLEQDLSEVLQTDRIFANVSKGEFAKAKDMQKVFGTKNEDEISKLILSKGQLQVSDKERSQQQEKASAQIAEWISKNCVQPTTDRPYTISQIRHAMQQANVSIHPTKPLKRQYLDCVKLLQKVVPIQRAKMELLLMVPPEYKDEMENSLKSNDVSFPDSEEISQFLKYQILVDPSLYRILNDAMQKMSGARIEIVNQVVTKQGDVDLEVEVGQQNSTIVATNDENVDSHTAQLMSKVNIFPRDEDNSDVDELEDTSSSRRKAQKKNKKKNRKMNRRAVDSGTDDTSSGVLSNELENSGQSVMSSQLPYDSKSTVSADKNSSDLSSRKSCNTCGGTFETPSEFRAHFKSDWHRFNQKLKMKGCTPVSEKEFLICDSDTFFTNDGIL
jgi:ribosome maturation protein SDO1